MHPQSCHNNHKSHGKVLLVVTRRSAVENFPEVVYPLRQRGCCLTLNEIRWRQHTVARLMVEKYKMAKAKALKKTTVNKHLSFLRQVFEKAIDWEKYDGPNPLEKVKQFKVNKGKKPGALAPGDVTALLDKIKHPVRCDMVDFAFQSGWRISEIRNLKLEDVDLKSCLAWIADLKNGQSVEIELNDEALEIIRGQPQRSEFVFCMVCGKQYTTNCFDGIYSAAKRAGVQLPKGKAWHAFRITWATLMHQNGADIPTLQQLGNWKNPHMPLHYAQPSNRERKRALLNKLPSVNGRNLPEKQKVVILSAGND